MNKYYDKKIPIEINVVHGGIQSGKNYYEFKKLKEEYITLEEDYGTCELENSKLRDKIKELEEENKTLKELNVCVGCNNNPDYKSRIDKAIKLLKEDYFEDGSGNNVEEVIKILKGEEK